MTTYLIRMLLLIIMLITPLAGEVEAQASYVDQISLLDGKKKAVIPFRYVHNFIIIDVRLYGVVPVQFIFDTGAEHVILFKREYTDMLSEPYDQRVPILGSDMSREVWALIMRNVMLEIKGLKPKPFDVLVLEENYFNLDEMIGIPVCGLIGGGFFKQMVVNIDYKKQKIVIYDPREFETPKGVTTVPIGIKSNKPYVLGEATLQDQTKVELELLVDTGAGVPVLLHNNSHPSLHLPDEFIKGKLGMGLGGYLEGHIGRIKNMRIGDLDFPSVLVSFQDVDTSWLEDRNKFRNGIIGNDFLSRFNTWFSYMDGKMHLKPYKSKPEPFSMDRSGLVIFAYGESFNQFVVKDVLEGSPAEKAGFQVNDVLLKVSGASSSLFTLDGINKVLQKKAGKKIRFKLRRGDQEIKKQIVLEDLI